jgi:Txe/YoeB family toxin of toxin-antitoxin system
MTVAYEVYLTPKAKKDLVELDRAGYGQKARDLLNILVENPFQYPPAYEKLSGRKKGSYSRRINAEHRLIYDVKPSDDEQYQGMVVVHRMRTHYKGMNSAIFFGSLIF